jgi:hypothetical protein
MIEGCGSVLLIILNKLCSSLGSHLEKLFMEFQRKSCDEMQICEEWPFIRFEISCSFFAVRYENSFSSKTKQKILETLSRLISLRESLITSPYCARTWSPRCVPPSAATCRLLHAAWAWTSPSPPSCPPLSSSAATRRALCASPL